MEPKQAGTSNLPNFFIIGAPKCGTTALHFYLAEHPRVFMPELKEPHFFSTELSRDCGFPATLEEYTALYRKVTEQHQAIGDASVFYLSSPYALPEFHRMMPQAKIIIMLRDLLDQFVSYHAQMRFIVEEDLPGPEDAWNAQEDRAGGKRIPATCLAPPRLEYRRVLSVGSQLARVYKIFPPEQVHLIWYDDFSRDTAKSYDGALDFLGLEKEQAVEFRHYNSRKEYRNGFIQKLIWRQPPWLRGLTRTMHGLPIIGKFRLNTILERLNSRSPAKPSLSPEFTARFLGEMEPEIALLEQVSGRDLSSWRRPRKPAAA
jgi:hypothetical protein